jgi:hypothetical protein
MTCAGTATTWQLPGRVRVAVLAAAICTMAAPMSAQQGRWTDRTRLAVSGGAQLTVPISESITLDKYVEPTPVTADAADSPVPLVDGGVIVRVAGNVGIAGAVSFVGGSREADVSAEIPHPFYFNRRRSISGQVAGVYHAEMAAHAGGVYLIAMRRVDVAVSGGASYFRVDQDLVSDVTFSETFPYDTASFTSASLTRVTETAIGYHAAADVNWKLSPRWGLGALVRFARAEIPFTVNGLDAGTAKVGGVQIAGGLRFIVPRRRRR